MAMKTGFMQILLAMSLLSSVAHICGVGAMAVAQKGGLLSTVYQFPNGTSVENIAVRSNGKLLVTLLTQTQIVEMDPARTSTPQLVYYFHGSTRVNGISKTAKDVFAVSTDHHTIWTMDLGGSNPNPQVTQIVTIPEASFLNGVTTLNSTAGTVLVADSGLAVIWLVNTLTGAFSAALSDNATMATAPIPGSTLALGVNGVRYDKHSTYLYYTNTGKQLFCRVQIDTETGMAVGPFETIVQGFAGDDFALNLDNGAAYVTNGSGNDVEKIFLHSNHHQEIVAGGSNSTDITGATSSAFGRRAVDADVLYITTNGGGLGGGKVVTVKV
jgi:hypothetical protein